MDYWFKVYKQMQGYPNKRYYNGCKYYDELKIMVSVGY